MENFMRLDSRKLTIIVLFSTIGAVFSFAVGYAGGFLSFAPLGPIGGQLLAGLHVFWLVLVATFTKSRGAAIMAGALKGTIEMTLPNHRGIFVLFMALLEGAVIEFAFLLFKAPKRSLLLFVAGLSSASNVLVLQAFQVLPVVLPLSFYAGMYGASFLSGLVLGGYLGIRGTAALEQFI
jgi:ABC-type thiamin/hydroxymethylpyrimidine transport system permease subunit